MSHHPSSSHMLSALIQYASGLLKLEICQSFSDLPLYHGRHNTSFNYNTRSYISPKSNHGGEQILSVRT